MTLLDNTGECIATTCLSGLLVWSWIVLGSGEDAIRSTSFSRVECIDSRGSLWISGRASFCRSACSLAEASTADGLYSVFHSADVSVGDERHRVESEFDDNTNHQCL